MVCHMALVNFKLCIVGGGIQNSSGSGEVLWSVVVAPVAPGYLWVTAVAATFRQHTSAPIAPGQLGLVALEV